MLKFNLVSMKIGSRFGIFILETSGQCTFSLMTIGSASTGDAIGEKLFVEMKNVFFAGEDMGFFGDLGHTFDAF